LFDDKNAINKFESLKNLLSEYKSVLVAYSGGVDSTFLLKVAKDVLKDNTYAVLAVSDLIPEKEVEEAIETAKQIGVEPIIIERDIYSNNLFMKNDNLRCYWCKKSLILKLKEIAKQNNIDCIIEGSNFDDISDYRPGMQALKEEGINSPLINVKLTKHEIRYLSNMLNLPTYSKPSLACLVTRIPYGDTITKEKLKAIENSEQVLKKYGFKQFRVRHHGDIARIEVEREERANFSLELMDKIANEIKKFGFKYVALDLLGYKTGNMN